MTKKPRKRRTSTKTQPSLRPVHPNAAGVDIGATEIHVAIPPDRDVYPVRRFRTFTTDLYALASWLRSCNIETVAMESTGVYWIPLYQILEAQAIEVFLVNARHVKNVPGRKTDISDCQWLQYLHAVGLLRPSFRPGPTICKVRSLVRHRDHLIQMASRHIQHMQKALDQMNLQLHHVISDITGKTGLAIIDALLAGERDPLVLARMRDPRIKAKTTTIAESLRGDYRREHLFTLRQSLAAYRHYKRLIAEVDEEIQLHLSHFQSRVDPTQHPLPKAKDSRQKFRRNEFNFDLRGELYRIFGVDLTQVPGLNSITAHTLLAEIGPDLSRFPNAAAFTSWLGLCPDNRISGGKVLSVKTRLVKNRAALALRMSAQSLHRSQSFLGEYYRRMRAKLGTPKAITATAHKLARIVFHLLTQRQPYDESVFVQQEVRYRNRTTAKLRRQARKLGFHLVPAVPNSQVP